MKIIDKRRGETGGVGLLDVGETFLYCGELHIVTDKGTGVIGAFNFHESRAETLGSDTHIESCKVMILIVEDDDDIARIEASLGL